MTALIAVMGLLAYILGAVVTHRAIGADDPVRARKMPGHEVGVVVWPVFALCLSVVLVVSWVARCEIGGRLVDVWTGDLGTDGHDPGTGPEGGE